jgi:hypothetical protein
MCRRYFALLLALSIILSFAPLRTDARAQAQSTDKAEGQGKSGAKPNAQAAQRPAPADKQSEKIKRTVNKVGVGQRITVFLKNGDTMHGTLAQVGEDDFQISEVDRRQTFTVRYDEVKKAREGFGGINLLTGQRTSHRRGTRIAVTAAAFAGVILLPIILVAASKD